MDRLRIVPGELHDSAPRRFIAADRDAVERRGNDLLRSRIRQRRRSTSPNHFTDYYHRSNSRIFREVCSYRIAIRSSCCLVFGKILYIECSDRHIWQLVGDSARNTFLNSVSHQVCSKQSGHHRHVFCFVVFDVESFAFGERIHDRDLEIESRGSATRAWWPAASSPSASGAMRSPNGRSAPCADKARRSPDLDRVLETAPRPLEPVAQRGARRPEAARSVSIQRQMTSTA